VRGQGCGSYVSVSGASFESGNVKHVLRGVFLVLDGVDRFGITFLHEIDLGPVVSSLGIPTRFVFFHPSAAFLLSVALNFAKIAVFAIPVVVASASRVAGSSA
jgi:hypothetical protein